MLLLLRRSRKEISIMATINLLIFLGVCAIVIAGSVAFVVFVIMQLVKINKTQKAIIALLDESK